MRRHPRLLSRLAAVLALGTSGLAAMTGAAGAQQPVAAPSGTIEGVVFDSLLAKRPLRRATVYVVGSPVTAITDDRGRFVITGVPEGQHSITFAHASLDTVGVLPPAATVRVVASARARVTIATPSAATLIAASCQGPRPERTGLLMGVVRDVDTGEPLRQARVASRWFELALGPAPRYATVETAALTDTNGVYRLCSVPSDIPVLVRAHTATHGSGRVEVYFAEASVAFRDFTVSLRDSASKVTLERLIEPTEDSIAGMGAAGTATVTGVVRDVTGTAVANAQVAMLDFRRAALTNEEGRFTMLGVPAGTQSIELRALGYQPVRRSVMLKSATTTDIGAVRLDRAAQKIAEVRVHGARRNVLLERAGFEDRRKRTNGFFMDADEIARKTGAYLGDVLRYVPGVIASYTPKGRAYVMRPKGSDERCTPTYYLNGMVWRPLDETPAIVELERFISANDIAGVEVYPSGAATPVQFDGGNCGVVLFWSK